MWACFNVYNVFDKKSSGAAATRARSETLVTQDKSAIKIEIISNQQLIEELHKPITRKFKKRKIYSFFKSNLVDMQLISKYNKGICFFISYFLCVVDIYIIYAWVIPLKDKKGIINSNACQKC